MRWLLVIPVLLFAGLLALLGLGLGQDDPDLPSPLLERPVPAFSVVDLHDADRRLTDTDLHDGPLVFNVWASWCVACRAEHDHLHALHDAGVTVIGLNYKDRREDALRYLQRYGNPYQRVGFDEQGRAGIEWGVYATPETFIVDRAGRVRFKQIGPLRPGQVQGQILPILRELEAET